MSKIMIYTFDLKNGEYKSEHPAQVRPNGQPILSVVGGTPIAPPEKKPGYARVFRNGAWDYVEDHRQTRDKGGVIEEKSGTPYWLPGDTYQTQARYMKELGSLPEGALLVRPEKPAEVVAEEALAAAKNERASLVAKSTVVVDGLVFDADEESQNRLSRGICAALALGLTATQTTEWTLADNSSAFVTVQQMARALLAAGQYQTSVWRTPYTQQTTTGETSAS